MEPEHGHDPTISPASSPEQLGAYELLNQIAAGEFCTVHRARARHGLARESVVLKRLRKAHQDAYGRARLLREGRAGLTLQGPHLVRVLEVHEQPEPFLVMEYVPGATLRELLVRSSKIDALPFIAPVVVDVLRALSALHDHRDAHGQPRPLVHQSPSARHMLVGEDGVTRLLDLSGVHRHGLGSNNVVSQRFLRGELAPEQLEFRVNVDARCDLFIVGKTLGEALARASALRSSRVGEAEVKSQCARLHELVARACAERREERFRSADHMASALQEAAEQADLFASPTQIAGWVQRCMHGTRFPPLAGQVRAVIVPPPPPRNVPPPPPRKVPPQPPTVPAARAPAPAPVEPAPTPVEASKPSEPPPVPARLSAPPAFTPSASARLGSVVGVAGVVALLTSLFTLGVRGLQHSPPTVSAARLAPEPAPAPAGAQAADARALVPMVSPLAAPRKRASPRTQVERAASASDFADVPTEISIETIAESIRAAQARRINTNSWVRPRKLRQELPENPY